MKNFIFVTIIAVFTVICFTPVVLAHDNDITENDIVSYADYPKSGDSRMHNPDGGGAMLAYDWRLNKGYTTNGQYYYDSSFYTKTVTGDVISGGVRPLSTSYVQLERQTVKTISGISTPQQMSAGMGFWVATQTLERQYWTSIGANGANNVKYFEYTRSANDGAFLRIRQTYNVNGGLQTIYAYQKNQSGTGLLKIEGTYSETTKNTFNSNGTQAYYKKINAGWGAPGSVGSKDGCTNYNTKVERIYDENGREHTRITEVILNYLTCSYYYYVKYALNPDTGRMEQVELSPEAWYDLNGKQIARPSNANTSVYMPPTINPSPSPGPTPDPKTRNQVRPQSLSQTTLTTNGQVQPASANLNRDLTEIISRYAIIQTIEKSTDKIFSQLAEQPTTSVTAS